MNFQDKMNASMVALGEAKNRELKQDVRQNPRKKLLEWTTPVPSFERVPMQEVYAIIKTIMQTPRNQQETLYQSDARVKRFADLTHPRIYRMLREPVSVEKTKKLQMLKRQIDVMEYTRLNPDREDDAFKALGLQMAGIDKSILERDLDRGIDMTPVIRK